MKLIFIFTVLFFMTGSVFSQNFQFKIDSIKNIISNETSDTAIFNKYIEMCTIYRDVNIDSSVYYTNKAKYIFDNLSGVNKNDMDTFYLALHNGIGLNYLQLGKFDSAKVSFNKVINRAKKTGNKPALLTAYINLGSLYDTQTEFNKALGFHLKSLKLAEELQNEEDLATAYNNVGLMHYQLGDYDRALSYYEKGLKIKIKLNDKNGMALLYNNIAIIYYFKDDVDKCMEYFKKALKIWETAGNKRRAAMVLSNLGELYLEVGLNKNAINYLEESIILYEDLKDYYNVVSIKKLIGQVYYEGSDFKNAEKYYNKALELSLEIGVSKETIDLYTNIATLDSAKGDFKSAYLNFIKYNLLNDSLFSVERKKAFDELQTKYETEKKEQQILLNEEQIKKQKVFNWALVIGILLVIIVAISFIRQNIIRKKANNLLMLKNAEIMQQKEEIETQRDEIETQRDEIITQRDIAAEQRDLITSQKLAITDSIEYAKRIQNAVLPKDETLSIILNEYFILFRPKDVVSGDFYWVKEINNLKIMLVADCTGHGVPGGFMSMLGIAFLNEIVKKPEVITSAHLLNELRAYVIEALKQKGNIGDQSDGMDIGVCIVDKTKNTVQYSGAFNSMYIITENNLTDSNKHTELIEFTPKEELKTNMRLFEHKPDKMPIAHFVRMDEFNYFDLQLNKGDIVYLFSDGYPDQFGGKKGKKFNYKRFKTLLVENAHKSMTEQQIELETNLDNWMGKRFQVDDITVLGYKV